MRVPMIHPNYHSGGAEIAGNWSPAWVAYLAGGLRRAGYTDLRFVDAMTDDLSEDALRRIPDAERPDVVGVTRTASRARRTPRSASYRRDSPGACFCRRSPGTPGPSPAAAASSGRRVRRSGSRSRTAPCAAVPAAVRAPTTPAPSSTCSGLSSLLPPPWPRSTVERPAASSPLVGGTGSGVRSHHQVERVGIEASTGF